MSDITLTSGFGKTCCRFSKLSDPTTTQEALATGKAVNPPPTTRAPIFTSQNLTNTANSLSSLLDQIGQGLQTIDAANNGLPGITSLFQQALSTVQQAQSAPFSTAGVTTGAVGPFHRRRSQRRRRQSAAQRRDHDRHDHNQLGRGPERH